VFFKKLYILILVVFCQKLFPIFYFFNKKIIVGINAYANELSDVSQNSTAPASFALLYLEPEQIQGRPIRGHPTQITYRFLSSRVSLFRTSLCLITTLFYPSASLGTPSLTFSRKSDDFVFRRREPSTLTYKTPRFPNGGPGHNQFEIWLRSGPISKYSLLNILIYTRN